MGEQLMSTMPLPIGSSGVRIARSPVLFAECIGFFFVFRVSLIFLFFQSNPVVGTELTIVFDLALIFAAILFTTNERARAQQLPLNATIHWIFALLAFSLASITWTGAQSAVSALGYWTGMVADIVIVLLLLRHRDVVGTTEDIMKGVVWGAAALALVAWCSPPTQDLRIGNEDFLHPNTLGLELAIATFMAQYLAPQGARWKWLGIGLAITLLRTLSKTSIIAFTLAECWYLMRTTRLSRKVKLRICAAALVVVVCFWPLLSSYTEAYNNTGSGNQAETLTGRTAIWAVAFTMGLDKPWLGHGLYSFRALVPAFGDFEPWEAHNELLQEFFEYGLVGVAIVAGTYLSFYRHVRRAPANELKALAVNVFVFALIHGLTDAVNFDLTYPLWLLTALSLCLSRSAPAEARSS
jgi:exopolysaccharide production protein ExoQ